MTMTKPVSSITENGGSLPTAVAKGMDNKLPQGDNNNVQAHESRAAQGGLKNLIHKPVFWVVTLIVLVVIVAVILTVWKMKRRKRRMINEEKTRTMIRWHRDRESV